MNEDRVLATGNGQFLLQKWSGENASGIVPCCDKVVVMVDPAMMRSKGGVILTDSLQESQTLASTTGVMVAVGPMAFSWNSDGTRRWEGDRPEVGARICFQRYSGQEYAGLDGKLYRVLQDRSIAGVMGMADIGEDEPAEAQGTAELFEAMGQSYLFTRDGAELLDLPGVASGKAQDDDAGVPSGAMSPALELQQ
jgi:co-chaperonin GroES (HSP10)